MKRHLAFFIILAAAAVSGAIWMIGPRDASSARTFEAESVAFECAGGKTFMAILETGYDDSIVLSLGGRQLVLPRTVSAAGVRYALPDNTVEFREERDEISIIENGSITYVHCFQE